MVNRIHHNATVTRATTQPTATTGLTANLKVVLRIRNNTDSGTARLENHTHLTARHLDDSILAVARHQLSIGTSAAHHLGTLARTKLDIVNQRTERNLGKSQSIANLGGNTITRHDSLTDFQTLRAEDITLLTVCVENKSNTGSTIRVVFDSLHDCGNTVLVSLEVDEAIQLLMATAQIAHGHLTLVVTATTLTIAAHQTLFRLAGRDVVIRDNDLMTLAGGCRFNFL